MPISNVLFLLALESVFFILLLCVFLKLAANRTKTHLQDVLKQAKNFESEDTDIVGRETNSVLRQRLLDQIQKLKDEIKELEIVESRYKKVKIENKRLQGQVEALSDELDTLRYPDKNTGDAEQPSSLATPKKPLQGIIQIGTTADRDGGVDQTYLAYLAQKKSLNEAVGSSHKLSAGAKNYDRNVADGRNMVASLRETIRQYQFQADVDAIKNESRDRTLGTLDKLEKSLIESQRTSARLQAELENTKNNLAATLKQVDNLKHDQPLDEGDQQHQIVGTKGYTVISRNGNADKDDESASYRDAIKYDSKSNLLKKEVGNLRETSVAQRKMIFELEAQIYGLREELKNKSLSMEEIQEKQNELERLSAVLSETEKCVEVLESEVEYLHGKLEDQKRPEFPENEINKIEQDVSYDNYMKLTAEVEAYRSQLNRADDVRQAMTNIILASTQKYTEGIVEGIATLILDAMELLRLEAHLRIQTVIGQVDVSNTATIKQDELNFLRQQLQHPSMEMCKCAGGFVIALSKLGLFVKGSDVNNVSIGRLSDTLLFMLLICNTSISNIEERHNSIKRANSMKKLAQSVKTNLTGISIQAQYQSNEAKQTMESFLSELNVCINTLNITERQSHFFDEMIGELRQRMKVIFATEVVVDSSLSKVIDRLSEADDM